MALNASPQAASPKPAKKTVAIIAAVLVGICFLLVVGFNQMFSQMSPHTQNLVRALGNDFIRGNWQFKDTKETAQRNLDESKQRQKQSAQRVDEAERQYQQALAEQKQAVVAAAAKRKAKKAAAAKKAAPKPVANSDPNANNK